jgi:GNAT superfamily N-acetyltransferase
MMSHSWKLGDEGDGVCEMVIRRALPTDAHSIVELFRSALPPSLIDRSWVSCSGAHRYIKGLCSHPSERLAGVAVLAAEREGRVIGAAQYSRNDRNIFLDYIAVEDSFRGAGVGSALLRRLALDPHGRRGDIVLDVLVGNPRAYEWYLRLGFVADGQTVWAESTLGSHSSRPGGLIRNWPQATALLARFGFAEFTADFGDRVVRVGLLGDRRFRAAGHASAEDVDLNTLLASIDSERLLLTIGPPPAAPSSGVVAELTRLRSPTAAVLARLEDT